MDDPSDPVAVAEVAWHIASQAPSSHNPPRTTDCRTSNYSQPAPSNHPILESSNYPSPMPEQIGSPICRAPIASEEAHFAVAYSPTAVAFDVVVPLAGSAAPVSVAAVLAVALAAAVEVSADHLGTDLKQTPPVRHMDRPAGRKSSQDKPKRTMQADTTS